MTSRQNGKEDPRDADNSHPQRQHARRNNVENDPLVDKPPVEDNLQLRHVPITDAEIISLSQLENLNNPSLTSLNLVKPPEINVSSERIQNLVKTVISQSSSTAKNTTLDSLPGNQTFARMILPLASRPIPDRDFSEFSISEIPNNSPIVMTRLNRPIPPGSSIRRANSRGAAQTGQGDQFRSGNILRTIKKPASTNFAKSISKPTPVTKSAKSISKPTTTIAASYLAKRTPSTAASRSILKPSTQTLVSSSILERIKTTRAPRTVLKPATITVVARPTPESTLTSRISRTSTVTSVSHIPTTTSCYLPDINCTAKPAKNIPTLGTKITTRKCYFPEVTCPTKIPRKAIFTSETCTTVTTTSFLLDKQHTTTATKTTRIDTETFQTKTKKRCISNILRRTRVPKTTTSYISSLGPTGTTCMTTTTLNTVSLLSTGIRNQEITDRPTMQPRIFSSVVPKTRHRAKTYVADSIIKPLPTSSESSPVRLVLQPKKNVRSTGIIETPSAGSITYGSTPIANTVSTATINVDLVPSRLEPSRSIESVLSNTPSLEPTTTETITPNQSVPSTQAPILFSPCFPIRQDPVSRYENRSHVVTPHPQDMPRFIRRTQPDLLDEHLTTCDSPPPRNEPRRTFTKTSHIHITDTLAQVGGSVNDSISSCLPVDYTAASRAPVHDVVASRAPMNYVATSCAPINVASTSCASPRAIVLAQNKKLIQARKKKKLKGIKRAQANPIDLQSSSFGDHPRLSTKVMSQQKRAVHRRPKQCCRRDNSVCSGYPTWQDENMSEVFSRKSYELKPTDTETSNDIGLLELNVMERLVSYLSDVQRYRGQQSYDEFDMN